MGRPAPGHGAGVTSTRPRRPTRGAVLTGVGAAITLDEVVFHQLLGWHHLVDSPDLQVGLASDGVLHILGTLALAAGLVQLVRTWSGQTRRALGGVLVGAGAFNVFDGTVNHKLLDLHQVRPGVPDQLPYDLAWVGSAFVVLLLGLALRRASPRHR